MGNGNENLNPRDIADIVPAYANNVFKYGRALVGTSRTIVWDGANGQYLGFLSAAAKVQVSSGSAEDDTGGGGATSIRVVGQDANGVEQHEDITLDGTTWVESTKEFTIIYRAYVLESEDDSELTGPNHGDITIRETGEATHIMAVITALCGQTLMCIYRIPTGKFGKIKHVRIFPAATANVRTLIEVFFRNNYLRGSAWQLAGSADIGWTSFGNIDLRDHERILQAGADIIVCASVSTGTANVSANFDIALEDL